MRGARAGDIFVRSALIARMQIDHYEAASVVVVKRHLLERGNVVFAD